MLRTRRFLLAALLAGAGAGFPFVSAQAPSAVAPPVLKWQGGGCGSFCKEYWYSSPAVADLDRDGHPEVIGSTEDLVVLDGATGALRASFAGTGRVWADVVVADLEGDGMLEILVARGAQVFAHRPTVSGGVMSLPVLPGWPVQPFPSGEVRALAVADLDGDGALETIAARGPAGTEGQVAVIDVPGTMRPGWPAIPPGGVGYGVAVYNNGLVAADLDANGTDEVYAGNDTSYLLAFHPDGTQVATHAMYGPGKVWSQVGVYVDHAVDLRGFAECGTEHAANFSDSAAAAADVDGDGTLELVVPAVAYNCETAAHLALLPWIFRHDRTRWAGSGFDWTAIPAAGPGSGPLTLDQLQISAAMPNAVVADLDGDGQREVLHASFDGRLHAWWLDKTEHGNWPYDVPGAGLRHATAPAVADLNGDGSAEVVFLSWGETGATVTGDLHMLDATGNPLHVLTLPVHAATTGSAGGLAAPTIANIDGDVELELVLATRNHGLVAYDLPGTSAARVRWGTGRGGYSRTGLEPEEIFADAFDLGGFTRWSSSASDGGDLSVSAAAGLFGSAQGLQATVDDTAGLYVQDDAPANENRYRARFQLDPNRFDPGESAGKRRTRTFIVFEETPTRRLAAVVLRRLLGQFSLMARVRRDDNSQANTPFFDITDAPHTIELDWRRASSPGVSDGRLDFWIDGVLRSTLTGIDNDASGVDFVRLGALSVKPTAAGTLFFDGFASRRRSYIGP
jgi:hypothetical protein